MKYIDEFRNKGLIQKALRKIQESAPGFPVKIMEVCGTHTQSFRRFGLHKALPQNVRLIAGPGCPVCVSHQGYLDAAIKLAQQKDTTLVTFGDMLRVPGTAGLTLEKKRAEGATVAVVYSALDSLAIARQNPQKRIVFLAVGFETTAPTIALTIMQARKEKLKNISFFSSLKLIPPVMQCLLADRRLGLSGFLCPGHVSTIIGTIAYEFIPRRYKIPCCVAGFEPLDMLEGIYMILRQIITHKPRVSNQYTRLVRKQGNPKAQALMRAVFKVEDASWRGLGKVPKSGLKIREEFSDFDTEKVFAVSLTAQDAQRKTHSARRTTQCRCAEVLKGLIMPAECPLFFKVCSPENPLGPCMVSSEGACNAHYKYH